MTRSLPVAGLAAGLMLFLVAVLALAYLAGQARQAELTEHATVEANGTLRRVYPVPTGDHLRTEVAYSFARGEGLVVVVPCSDRGWSAEGWEPRFVIERQGPAASGFLVVDGSSGGALALGEPIQPIAPAAPSPGDQAFLFCSGRSLVFEWDAAAASSPTVRAVVHDTPLDGGPAQLAVAAAVVGLLAVAVSGAWMARRRPAGRPPESETTVETLVEALRLSTEWLERSRTHLLVAGLLGIVVWYPVLLPWAWSQGAEASSTPWGPWLLAGLLGLGLLGATLVWGWRLLALDRDLRHWRDRLESLRRREQDLLAGIESP
jgi:hypothetical protein